MGSLARFSDSLEEMEPSSSPPKRTQRCKRSHGQAFPTARQLCSPPLPSPSTRLCRERAVFRPGGSTTLSCTSQSGYVCGRVQPSKKHPTRLSHPHHWNVLVYPVLILLAPRLPRPSLQAQMLFGGEEAGFTPGDPRDFLCWAHGKGSMGRVVPAVAACCSDICIPGPCQSSPRHRPRQKI